MKALNMMRNQVVGAEQMLMSEIRDSDSFKQWVKIIKEFNEAISELEALQQHIKDLETQLSSNPLQLTCEWNMDDPDWNTYKTGCGKYFNLVEGNLKDNEFNNCPYCGGIITLKEIK